MVMQAMHSGRGSKVLKTFFFTLLVIAAFGLVLSDVGGFFSGGVSNNDVAKVGNEKVSIVSFDRSARRVLARMNATPEQAYQMGYIDNILDSEIRSRLFQQIAAENGIVISKPLIAEQISTMIKTETGIEQDQQMVFDRLLANQGYTEPEFVKAISAEISAGVLGRAIQNKFLGDSETMARDLYQITYEKRALDIVTFLDKDAQKPEAPTDGQIAQLYESMKENFSIPESREITVGILKDSDLQASIDVSEDTIRGLYDENIDTYTTPEERVIEQAVLSSEDEAKKVLEAIKDGGSSLKDASSSVTGEATSYIDAQSYREDGLPDELSALVFADNEAGKNYGPVQSALGWHVLAVKEIKAPHIKSYESVKEQLKKTYIEDEFSEKKYSIAAEIDDLLAGGTPVEDVAKDFPIEVTTAKDVTALGAMASQYHELDKFGENASAITQAALQYGEGESTPVSELPDGRMYFVHVDKLTPKSYKPLDEVRESLETLWTRDQQRMNNKQATEKALQQALAEEKSLSAIASENKKQVATIKGITKNDEPPAPLTSAALPTLFAANEGDTFVIDVTGGLAIARITSISLPEVGEKAPEELEAIRQTLIKDAGDETISIYFENKRKDYTIKINEGVLKRVYGAQDPES